MKIFVFIIATTVAFLMIRFRFLFRETFGVIDVFERWLGSTETGVVVCAILLFIWGLMYMMGTLDGFIENSFGKFF